MIEIPMYTTKKRVTCCTCGGENVLIDAWAAWSFEKQEWELQNTFQQAYCEDCDGETSWEGVLVKEPAPVIQTTKG